MQRKKVIVPLILSATLLVPTISATTNFLSAEQSIDYEFRTFNQDMQDKKTEHEKINKLETKDKVVDVTEEEVVLYPNYNPYNLLEPSNMTREMMYDLLEGTRLQALSRAFVYMEEVYGVNSLFLVGLTINESGWGKSELAMYNNNLAGIKSKSGGYAYFDSWGDCLSYMTDLLKHEYLTKDGKYYNGLSVWNVNVKYCEQLYWSDHINQIIYGLIK